MAAGGHESGNGNGESRTILGSSSRVTIALLCSLLASAVIGTATVVTIKSELNQSGKNQALLLEESKRTNQKLDALADVVTRIAIQQENHKVRIEVLEKGSGK